MIERERTQESGAPHGESAAGRFEKKLLRGGQLQVSERLQESELRSQELQELQNTRVRSLSGNPGPASPWENLRQAPRFSSLKFSQVSPLVRSSPVASCLGSSLQGRKLSLLAPTDVGTPCAFLTGREKCGLAPELLQLLTPEFRIVLGGQAQVSKKFSVTGFSLRETRNRRSSGPR